MANDYNGLLSQLYGQNPMMGASAFGPIDLGKNPGYGANSGMGQGQPVTFGQMPHQPGTSRPAMPTNQSPQQPMPGPPPPQSAMPPVQMGSVYGGNPQMPPAPVVAVQQPVVPQPVMVAPVAQPDISVPMVNVRQADGSTHSVPAHMAGRYAAYGYTPDSR